MNKLRVIELFAGIGAWSKALENLGVDHKVVAAVEFDEKTMECYNVIHGSNFVAQDITSVNLKLPDCDVIFYSPPCQTFSIAGKGEGTKDARGTLFHSALRIINEKQPKYCIMENVKNLTGKSHRETFVGMLALLRKSGYTNYWRVLNSKEHGVPQSRERVFIVSIRNDIQQPFYFAEPYDKGLRLKDVLEDIVDEKYYIADNMYSELLEELKLHPPKYNTSNEINVIGRCALNGHDMLKRIYSIEGISPTIPTGMSGNTMPKILVNNRIRKVTPLETIRLQGFSDEDYYKLVDAGMSNSQIYKVTGNSISVPVVKDLIIGFTTPCPVTYCNQRSEL